MPRPTSQPRWADDPVDPIPGTAIPVITEPSEEVKSQGWILEKPPVGTMNWLFNTLYQWTLYLAWMLDASYLFTLRPVRTMGFEFVRCLFTDPTESLIVGGGNDGKLESTPDGFTWTVQTTGLTGTLLFGAASDDIYLICDNSGATATSADCASWSTHSPAIGTFLGLIYSAAEDLFILTTTAGIYTSPGNSGDTWTQRLASTDVTVGVAEGDGLFVAVGVGKSWTSADALTWTPHTSVANVGSKGIAWANDYFVSIDYSGSGPYVGTVSRSADGETWVVVYTVAYALETIAARSCGHFVVSAYLSPGSGTILVSVDTGATWETVIVAPDTSRFMALLFVEKLGGLIAGDHNSYALRQSGASYAQPTGI